jgi:hypothetical protein
LLAAARLRRGEQAELCAADPSVRARRRRAEDQQRGEGRRGEQPLPGPKTAEKGG